MTDAEITIIALTSSSLILSALEKIYCGFFKIGRETSQISGAGFQIRSIAFAAGLR